jgi:hypothetical protein
MFLSSSSEMRSAIRAKPCAWPSAFWCWRMERMRRSSPCAAATPNSSSSKPQAIARLWIGGPVVAGRQVNPVGEWLRPALQLAR